MVAAGAQEGGGLGIRLLEVRPDQAGDPRASIYLVDHVAPGGAVQRRIEVTNTTAEPLDVDLYAAAAAVGAAGFEFADGGGDPVATWTTVEPGAVTLPPGSAATATVTVTVPADAPAGEHYGVVWAATSAGRTGGVETVHRVGVRMFVTVGAGGEPSTDFVVGDIRAGDAGEPSVVVRVTNTGGRAIDLLGELQLLDGPGGTSTAPVAAPAVPTIAVGAAREVSFAVPADLPPGTYTARVTLRSGAVERSAEAGVTFDDSRAMTAARPSPGDGASGGVLVPGVIAAAMAAVVAASLAVVVGRRRAARP